MFFTKYGGSNVRGSALEREVNDLCGDAFVDADGDGKREDIEPDGKCNAEDLQFNGRSYARRHVQTRNARGDDPSRHKHGDYARSHSRFALAGRCLRKPSRHGPTFGTCTSRLANIRVEFPMNANSDAT